MKTKVNKNPKKNPYATLTDSPIKATKKKANEPLSVSRRGGDLRGEGK